MKYLKKFQNHTAYETYINGSDVALPNVSLCVQQNDVHYNPLVIAQPLIATYNVTDASNPTLLFVGIEIMGFSASTIYDKIEIDNVEINMSDLSSSEQEGTTFYSYQLTSGEHTVKYTLKDPTMIGAEVDEETGMPSKLGATFMSCPITSVEIPSSVTTIGNAAFNGCSSLTSVTISNSVTSIGFNAFWNCSSLTSVTIPNSVTSIGNYTFSNCSGLTSVTIPNTVTSIGEYAFNECRSLTSITIPNTVTSISEGVFQYCSGLTSVTIPNTVTSIGEYAFYGCSSLASITIPSGVTSIGTDAFNNCNSLTSATIEATTPPTIGGGVFASLRNYTIWVPASTANIYKAASGWSEYASRIHEVGEILF